MQPFWALLGQNCPTKGEITMKGFVEDIEKLTEENGDYRRVLYTGKHFRWC